MQQLPVQQPTWLLGHLSQAPATREHVDEGGLADIGPPNDGKLRVLGGHGASSVVHAAADVLRHPHPVCGWGAWRCGHMSRHIKHVHVGACATKARIDAGMVRPAMRVVEVPMCIVQVQKINRWP